MSLYILNIKMTSQSSWNFIQKVDNECDVIFMFKVLPNIGIYGKSVNYNIPLQCTYDKTLFPSHVQKTIYNSFDVTIMFKK